MSPKKLLHFIPVFVVRGTLTDLKLAIEGTIVMSDELRYVLDAMYDARQVLQCAVK